MEENAAPLAQPIEKPGVPKKVILIVGSSVLFILIVIITLALSLQKSPSNQVATKKPLPTPGSTSQKTTTPPKVIFGSYKNASLTPNTATTYKTYSLKNNFTETEAASFAQKLGLTKDTSKGDFISFINTTDPEKRGALLFNTKTGQFSYTSLGIQKPSVLAKPFSPQLAAVRTLVDLGMYDDTIVCRDTYTRRGFTNVTFIECHREADKLGAALVQIPGILNLPEATKLSTLKAGNSTPDLPIDSSILTATNGKAGVARANDFNTVTIALSQSGQIVSIESSLRLLNSTTPATGQIMSSQEALQEFENHKASLSLTLPAGRGNLDWNSVYPKNQATAKAATISEIALVYTENAPGSSQQTYEPTYLIRGTATLDSGYTVRFVESLPALKTKIGATSVAGETTYLAQNSDIQIGTFRPTTGTPSPSPTAGQTAQPTARPTQGVITLPTNAPLPTAAPTVSFPEICSDAQGQELTFTVPGYGSLTVVRYPEGTHTYFFKSTTAPNPTLDSVRRAFSSVIEEQFTILTARVILAKVAENPGTQPGQYIERAFDEFEVPFSHTVIISPEMRGRISVKVQSAIASNGLNALAGSTDLFPEDTVTLFVAIIAMAGFTPGTTFQYPGFNGSCYLSGATPLLFLYPETTSQVTIQTSKNTIYQDPPDTQDELEKSLRAGPPASGTWTVIAEPDGRVKTSSGISRNALYYEYNKGSVHFSDTKEGFIIKKSELKQFTTSLGEKIGLKKAEIDGLFQELTKAAAFLSESSNYWMVSLIREKEIREKLPLSISPTPDSLYRLHFLVTESDENSITEVPVLPKIIRSGFTAIEIGAYSY